MSKIHKFPISWHEDCIVNLRATLASHEEQIERLRNNCVDMRREILRRTAQIARAKRMKVTEFDQERFKA